LYTTLVYQAGTLLSGKSVVLEQQEKKAFCCVDWDLYFYLFSSTLKLTQKRRLKMECHWLVLTCAH